MAYRVAGLIGLPVSSSRSPMIFRYWLDRYGLAGDYVRLAVAPDALEAALRGLPALGFAGANVTMPHKETAARLMDRLDATAQRMGAVNLIVVEADGSLSGYNKDGYGFIQNLHGGKAGWVPGAGAAVVLGAGGAARGIVVSLLEAGVPSIRLLNRTLARAQALRDDVGGAVEVLPWSDRHDALAGAALLVNTTNQGMAGHEALDLRLDALPRDVLVCDIIYNPLTSPLLAAAAARGNPVVNGLGMLLHQARPAFEAWWGVAPEITPELRAAVEATI